ncbi:putative n-acetyltransferase mak3 [Linderina pennispora]|uniref:Putative n-acetyltransferase mak3 n=1 Tax=Linderina pennispora TaxID=61395 RepID=A0A1Y1W2I4_9FUNG|nr:putative n-acetyltransferase mak3 [Linderina pennispora]ORX67657.1 putative n-acetyltransferase mak3 [Linderina pennispora]
MALNFNSDIHYTPYVDESDLDPAIKLIESGLSEPYSIYTYRYFVQQWPELCLLARNEHEKCVGVIICKLEPHPARRRHSSLLRGYIGMVAVDHAYRKRGIGSTLVLNAIDIMKRMGADEVILETETKNKGALSLYEAVGFIREKCLCRYYMDGSDAFRLKMWIGKPEPLVTL